MSPRLSSLRSALQTLSFTSRCPSCQVRAASIAAQQHTFNAQVPILRHPPTQPPSRKSPSSRKSQLMRQYQSLLQTNPLIVIFQHNSLKASEWAAIRRQLHKALQAADQETSQDLAPHIRIQIINTALFEAALKVVEFYRPPRKQTTIHPTDPSVASPKPIQAGSQAYTHGLSTAAFNKANRISRKRKHGLEALLSGPLSVLTLPSSSPEHLAAALKILAPGKDFPAPKRKANPEYYEPSVQGGLQKLLMLGARIEGKAMDSEGTRWVGGIEGGLTGLRAQLVGMLSTAGVGLASVLEGAGRSLWVTLEGRRMDMAGELEPEKTDSPAEETPKQDEQK